MSSATIVAGVRRVLLEHPPFSLMDAADLDFVARRVELAYFADDELIVGPQSGPPAACWIVRQGAVHGRRPDAGADAATTVLAAGETFPVGALLADRPVGAEYRAVGDTFCWRLAKADFDEAVRRSPVFLDFCKRRLGVLLDLSKQALQASYARQATQWRSMATSLAELIRRTPVVVGPEASLREVFELMERERVGSVIVGQAQGIFTRQDVIGRVTLPGVALDTPIHAVMTRPLLSLESSATAAEAMLLMAERTIRHVPVMREGTLVGVVTERDLFAMQRQSLRGIGDAIGTARSIAALAIVASDIRTWSSSLVAQGVAAAFATRLISRLNDQLSARVIALVARERGVSIADACWLALGSEGREEQTIATDQDNGLIVPDGIDRASVDRLLDFAATVNRALDICGFPLCRGGIMAGNPRWCLSESEWRALFDGWVDRGDPRSLLEANIFFDFRAIAGDASRASRLREHVTRRAAGNPRFLKQMSDNALRNGPPASWTGLRIGSLFGAEVTQVDLKLNGTVPFVDGARLLALAHGIPCTGTAERLQALADAGRLLREETRAWIDAFQFLQSLRLRTQQAARAGADAANVFDTEHLSDIDRRILRESFRLARTLQQRLALDFPG